MGLVKKIALASNPEDPEGHFDTKMLTRGATRALLGLRAAAKQQMVPVRNFRYETVVSGPPRTPISTVEKLVHFGVICVAFLPLQHISWRTSRSTGDWRDSNS